MRRNLFIFIGLLLFPLYVSSQIDTVTVFVNTGEMYVDGTAVNDTALSILGSIRTLDKAQTFQAGKTVLTGHFYHDARPTLPDERSNAFATEDDGWGTSTGTIIFAGLPISSSDAQYHEKRYITTTDFSTFNRKVNYAAFPNIEMATRDTLVIPSQMGLDVETIDFTGGGKMLLKSTVETGDVYDASLRVSKENTELPAGKVIIERDLSLYRATGSTASPLFAFASPMKDMRSGYFAGNWIRKTLANDANG